MKKLIKWLFKPKIKTVKRDLGKAIHENKTLMQNRIFFELLEKIEYYKKRCSGLEGEITKLKKQTICKQPN